MKVGRGELLKLLLRVGGKGLAAGVKLPLEKDLNLILRWIESKFENPQNKQTENGWNSLVLGDLNSDQKGLLPASQSTQQEWLDWAYLVQFRAYRETRLELEELIFELIFD